MEPADDGPEVLDEAAPGHADADHLDYLSFIDHAIGRATAERPDLDAAAMRMVLTLHRLASTVVYDLESTVHRPSGWTWPGFRLLFVLWLAGPMEAKRAAELSGTSRAAVSALANTLERDGLLGRRRDTLDRRSVRLSLTTAGRASISAAFGAHNAREQAWADTLTDDELATFNRLLDKLIQGPQATRANRRF
ncbi:MarR family winged helix-turn-helix transcriptional regulator [Phytoactinopolyspora limicola]|uniref:MarR family winged helix-turn-helix transcriptional regulator n=1 Tax=Phytoactinopolyspora limicola TaxID=2715536 RepID=UPI001A9C9876|nr:MarR family transcriptional regulator [Phytoactinopolyspora limicola]